ncbi:Protein of unknown function [Propionibacterium freudenreichii]|nr:Protein of unknown function [Propionibacterium freudenreichii]
MAVATPRASPRLPSCSAISP